MVVLLFSVVGAHTAVCKKFGVGQTKFGVDQSCIRPQRTYTSEKAHYNNQLCVHEHTHLASHISLLHHRLFIYYTCNQACNYLLSLIPGYPPPRTAGLRPTLRPRRRLRPWCAGGDKIMGYVGVALYLARGSSVGRFLMFM